MSAATIKTHCAACGQAKTANTSTYCRPCNREVSKAKARRTDRSCHVCRRPIQTGRQSSRCPDCDRQYMREWRTRPGRRCRSCGTSLRGKKHQTHCPDCRAMHYQEKHHPERIAAARAWGKDMAA